jgi:CSLREA domain-containing protein
MIRARTERPAGTKALVLGLLLVAFIVLSLMLAAKPARASTTFTVNNTVDPGNGTCSASGCSLREAITAANNTPGEDLIRFNILGGLRPGGLVPRRYLPG